MFILGLCGTWEATEHSRALSAVVVEVLEGLNLKGTTVAEYVDLPEKYVNDSLNNARPLAFWRFLYLVPGFRRRLLDVLAAEENCVVLDRDVLDLAHREREARRRAVRMDLPDRMKESA